MDRKTPITPQAKRKGAKPLSQNFKDTIQQLAREHKKSFLIGLTTLKQHPLSAWLTILAIGIILVLPLGGYVVFNHINTMTQYIDKGNQLTIFLKIDVKQNEVQPLIQQLQAIQEIESIEHQTPDSALAEFQAKTNLGDLMTLLPKNPLPNVLVINPRETYQSYESMQALKDVLEKNPKVDHIVMDLDWVKKIEALSQLIAKIVSLISLFISVGCIVILSNTIRLSLERHREELFIFSLMGATQAYIRRPFIYRAIIYGLLGALLAYCFVFISLQMLKEPTAALAELYRQVVDIDTIPLKAFIGLIFFSLTLSWLSAKLAIWQYHERLK